MHKRGQVTIFMIIGILILIIMGSFFLIKSYSEEKRVETEAEIIQQEIKMSAPVKQYIESCLDSTGKKALLFVGKHGGYYELPLQSDDFFLMPYYFYDNKSHLISKKELEIQISNYINHELFFCVKNFVFFEEHGYDIKQEDVSTSTIIAKNKVILNLNFPVTLAKGDSVQNIFEFTTSINSRLGIVYEVIKELLEEQENDLASICISCGVVLGIEHDLRIEMNFIEEGEMMFTIVDEKFPIEQEPFIYNYINKYKFEEFSNSSQISESDEES